jgi:hypothetical protein
MLIAYALERLEQKRLSEAPQNTKVNTLLVGGIEPSTLGLLDPRSNQLSYTSNLCNFVVSPI